MSAEQSGDPAQSAQAENMLSGALKSLWIDPKDILEYRLVQEQMLYDVNMDGIME